MLFEFKNKLKCQTGHDSFNSQPIANTISLAAFPARDFRVPLVGNLLAHSFVCKSARTQQQCTDSLPSGIMISKPS